MNIQKNLDDYLRIYPREAHALKQLKHQLEQGEDILSRKNFSGHVTASTFIINERDEQVLLLEHKALVKFLQPGGHIDATDSSPLEAALREAEEETGLNMRLQQTQEPHLY